MKKSLLFLILTLFLLSSNANAKLVGITIDYRKNINNEYKFTTTSFYAIRDNYVSSFQKACKKYDVTVVLVPLDKTMIKNYTKIFDGMVFSGNYYDIDPKLYRQKLLNDTVKLQDRRKNEFEIELFKNFYQTKKPIFGICGGYQMINVMLGGELYQDIPSQIKESKINHAFTGKKCAHEIKIIEKEGIFKNSLLQSKKNKEKICVNSTHHQAISKIATELEVVALAPDNIIEAYKAKNHPFMIGVQWHPEYEISKFDSSLIEEFCKAVAKQEL